MTLATRPRSRTPVSEEAMAAARVVLALTVGVGGMAALMGWGNEDSIALIAVPVLVLVIAIVRGAVPVAGWAGVAVWAALLPSAHGEALLAPIAMMVLCLAIAIGPDRLASWIGRNVAGRPDAEDRQPEGWIEEDGHPVE
jgi:hypothetical protein